VPAEGRGRGGRGVRPEQPAPVDGAPLVGVERGGEGGVERVAGGEQHAAGDREGQQRGAARGGARRGEALDLVGGEQVEQRRRRDHRRAGELRGVQGGEVADLRLGGDARRQGAHGPVDEVGVAVVQQPALRAGQPAGEPAAHRAGAAAEVTHDDRCVARPQAQPDAQAVGEVGGTGVGVGRLAQREPVRGDR
jgi:hypothetical protein